MKAQELVDVLKLWHPDTEVFINITDNETEYEWHEFLAWCPSDNEIEKLSDENPSYTTLDMLPGVVGC